MRFLILIAGVSIQALRLLIIERVWLVGSLAVRGALVKASHLFLTSALGLTLSILNSNFELVERIRVRVQRRNVTLFVIWGQIESLRKVFVARRGPHLVEALRSILVCELTASRDPVMEEVDPGPHAVGRYSVRHCTSVNLCLHLPGLTIAVFRVHVV